MPLFRCNAARKCSREKVKGVSSGTGYFSNLQYYPKDTIGSYKTRASHAFLPIPTIMAKKEDMQRFKRCTRMAN